MVLPMLVVDKNIEVSQREQAEWQRHGISTVRVDTMLEAIEMLTKESFLFTAINADSTNYLPLLKVMRNTSPALIFIIDSTFTKEKEIEALRQGADVYTQFNNDVELNVQLAFAQLLRCHDRDKKPSKPPGMIIYDNFLVLSHQRRIFCNDQRLSLTKKEYDILHYLISNHDCPLSYAMIYRKVWGRDYDKDGHKYLWDHILRIRKKLKEAAGDREYIITERDVGYRFTTTPATKK